LDLSDRLRNICFIQGLASDRIQTIVRSRNYQNLDEIAESALVEDSAIQSKQERYRAEGASAYRCSNCGKPGHSSNKLYSRSKGQARINPIVASGSGAINQVTCFRCGEKGHIARNYRKPPRRKESDDNHRTSGNEVRRPEEPPNRLLYSVGCANKERCDYITLELDVNQGHKLHFLVDSGPDINLVKSYKLLGTAEFEPKDRARVKSVEGSVIETHGSIETRIRGGIDIPFHFQLVSKQVDLKGDGILGRDILKSMQVRICYKERSLTFRQEINILTAAGTRST